MIIMQYPCFTYRYFTPTHAFELLSLAITYTKSHESAILKGFPKQNYSYLFVSYFHLCFRLVPAWSRYIIRKSKKLY